MKWIATLGILLCTLICVYIYVVSEVRAVRLERKAAVAARPFLTTLAQSLRRYAAEHQGKLPVADVWCDSLVSDDPNLAEASFINPSVPEASCGFAFNKNLSDQAFVVTDINVVLLSEAIGSWNLSGADELLTHNRLARKSHIGVVFVDGEFAVYSPYFGLATCDPCAPSRYRRPIWRIEQDK